MIERCARWGWQFRWIVFICELLSVSGLPAEPPKLVVSSFALDNLTLAPPTSTQIAARLAKEAWCAAESLETNGAWNEVPRGVDRRHWVSLVTVGFNGQADAYALMFDGPAGAMSMATHVPFREVWLPGGTAAWIWPTDSVVGALRVSYQERLPQSSRRMLKLAVVAWENAGPDLAAVAKTSDLEDARTLAPELVLPPVAVMTHAAAFDAGWAPTTADAPWSATCEVRVEDQACSFRLTLRTAKLEQTFTKLHVPWETYHDHLVRLFRYVEDSRGVSDFWQVTRNPAELLTLHNDQLACLLNHELTVFDLATGRKTWTTEPTVRPANYLPVPQYTQLSRVSRPAGLVRYRASLAEFNWESGKMTVLARSAADGRHRFSADAAGDLAASSGGKVSVHRQGQSVWEQTEADAISAGPLLTGDNVVYGQVTGRLVARSAKDGQVRWQSRWPGSLYGKIVPTGDSLLVFSNATETLLAVDATQGTARWQTPLGDVLLESPLVIGNQILLVTKGNRLLLLSLDSGKVQKEVLWPTWLVSVTLIDSHPEPMFACSDLAGNITLLSLNDLQPTHTIQVGVQLSGPVLYSEKLSYSWPVLQSSQSAENLAAEIKSGPLRTGPGLLAADTQGFIYILPLTSSE